MSIVFKLTCVALVLVSLVAVGCGSGANRADNSGGPAKANKEAVQPNKDGTIPSGTGTEKEKPAAGKAHVQGKAFFNEKPAVGVQVKLCKTFSQYMSGCGGETFTAKTDDAGEYLIKDVTPGIYEGLTVQVFETPYYVFATSGIQYRGRENLLCSGHAPF
jgi:hypothetical protein